MINGIKMIVHETLPYPERRSVCSIETKEEFMIHTGGEIDVIHNKLDDVFLVSQRVYDQFKKELNELK